MVKIFWKIGRWDYDNELGLIIRIRNRGGKEITVIDMVDIIEKDILSKIKQGQTSNEIWEELEIKNE